MLNQEIAESIRILEGFDDPSLDETVWQNLLGQGQTDTVFLTRWWLKTWWATFGRGQLLLLGVFRDGELVGLAPLFADEGMVFFIGSGGSDYLDFVGDVSNHESLTAILARAAAAIPGFVGFRFYHVPDTSGTGLALQEAAQRLGYACFDEGDLPAPTVDLRVAGDKVTQKRSLVRHQRFLEREGTLSVRHFTSNQDILPRLDLFFDQHIDRWAVTRYPSLFIDATQRRFYELLTKSPGSQPWLRFTEVCWNNVPIAFHFGFHYADSYIWYKPSFAIAYAKRSPGEVLLRNLLLAALNEGAIIFDLGLGNEAFKARFATHTRTVRTWGLYPPDGLDSRAGERGR